MIVFLIYPLIRLFYDSLHDRGRGLHPRELPGFLHGPLLPQVPAELHAAGGGHGHHHLHHRHRLRLPAAALRFPGPGALLVSVDRADDHAAAGRGHGVRLHPGPRRNGQHHPAWTTSASSKPDQLHVRHPRACCWWRRCTCSR
ncbi:MAG: hypothetical protein MZV70_71200 [Desulfobacterales bacterium]|nr:hypothetical protein [Desulfobacterales bacterium]